MSDAVALQMLIAISSEPYDIFGLRECITLFFQLKWVGLFVGWWGFQEMNLLVLCV